MISNEDIIYNHQLLNLEYLDWSIFNSDLAKYRDNYIYEIFKELDCDRYTKSGQQLMSVTHYEYPILLTKAIRLLDKIHDYTLYNTLFTTLCSLHNNNNRVCEDYAQNTKELEEIKRKQKKPKKPKVKDEFVKSISTDLFDGTPKYIYSNLKTGQEIISDNPDLLEELNKPKEKKRNVRVSPQVVSLPSGFTFKFNKK